ncbi:MAG: GNAT family N-acetyltransferase [Lachnospiraceae bacterium]|nr:GNAT family N-acetyltransferase [Lachnospiraceae bacterium]
MEFETIKANIQLAEDMGYVHSKSWQKAYRGIIPDHVVDAFTPEKRTEVFKEAIASRPEEYYLFKANSIPAGIALLHKSHEKNAVDTDGEIYAIYFHPDFWGTDVTHKAFEFCINRLKERGFTKINIWVLEDNKRARKFYEKYGFVFDGSKQQVELGKPLTEIRYSKNV